MLRFTTSLIQYTQGDICSGVATVNVTRGSPLKCHPVAVLAWNLGGGRPMVSAVHERISGVLSMKTNTPFQEQVKK